jgi:hypothetical protein
MTPYIVSSPYKNVAISYARWRGVDELPERTVMHDGWTLPSLKFEHLYQAQAAAVDLAMVSGSERPFVTHGILITEFHGDTKDFHS